MTAAPQTGGNSPQHIVVNSGKLNVRMADPLRNPRNYKVNVPKTTEFINQPFYSYILYPAAGSAALSFFQTPAGGAVTRQDTNMELAGQIPAPQMFLIQGIGVDYLPGTTTSAPVQLGAESIQGGLLDFYTIMRQGQLVLTIGAKEYLTMSPLLAMPPRAHMDGVAATSSSTTAAAALNLRMEIPFSTGDVFKPVPLLLEANQNFRVNINFPAGAVAPPSGDALARIGVILYGTLYRPAQ